MLLSFQDRTYVGNLIDHFHIFSRTFSLEHQAHDLMLQCQTFQDEAIVAQNRGKELAELKHANELLNKGMQDTQQANA